MTGPLTGRSRQGPRDVASKVHREFADLSSLVFSNVGMDLRQTGCLTWSRTKYLSRLTPCWHELTHEVAPSAVGSRPSGQTATKQTSWFIHACAASRPGVSRMDGAAKPFSGCTAEGQCFSF